MGTSGSSRGPGSNTPLVPTWLDEPAADQLPGSDSQGDENDIGDGDGTNDQPDTASPPIQPATTPTRFRSARGNFSRFASSGGNDHGALRRAVRDYVRSGTGGSRNATRRMGASRAAASSTLGIFRGFQRDGVDATLRRLNLVNFIGRPSEDVFLGLTEVICQDGGSIDEGIARDAWLETVTEIDQFGIEDLSSLTIDQMQEVFLAFVAHAIEKRLFQDIGAKGLSMPADLSAIEAFESQFKSYIRRSVRDSFSSDLAQLETLSDQQIKSIVDKTYREAWGLLELWGDAEG